MNSTRVLYATGFLLVVVTGIYLSRGLWVDEKEKDVQEIINTSQTYDGEHIDKLVGLGVEAVPAIGKALTTGEEFPLRFVLALEKIGDESGARPVLQFLAAQEPYADSDRSFITSAAMLSLIDIGGSDSLGFLENVLENDAAHVRVRLAAAAALASLASGARQLDARNYVIDAYDNRQKFFARPNDGFTESEIYRALLEVNNSESTQILLGLLEYGAPAHILKPTIDSLANQGGDTIAAAIVIAVRRSDTHELPIRLHMASALVRMDSSSNQLTATTTELLMAEAKAGGWSTAIMEEAQRLDAVAKSN